MFLSLIEISNLGNLLFRGGDGFMERVSTSFQQMPLQLKHMFVLYAVQIEELFVIRVRRLRICFCVNNSYYSMLCSFYILTDIMEPEGEVSYTERGQGF